MRYTATALSPVHVGLGEVLTPLDFAVQRDSLAVFDPARLVDAEHADRLEAALAGRTAPAALTDLFSAAELADANRQRYSIPAAEFIRIRLRGEGPIGKPAPAAPAPATPAAPRKDLRGGLGSRLRIDLPNLPPPPPAPEPKLAPKPAAPPPLSPRGRGVGGEGAPAREPERPPPENFVEAFLKQPVDDGAYLPGSTIKGALRTALLFHLLQEHEELRAHILGALDQRMFDRSYHSRAAGNDLEDLLAPGRPGAKLDYLAALSVADSDPLPPAKCLQVEMTRAYSPRTDRDGLPMGREERGRPPERSTGGMRGGVGGAGFGARIEHAPSAFRGPPVYLEAVRGKTQFAGNARLDDHYFQGSTGRGLQWPAHLPPLSVPLLCKAANALARRVLDLEYQYFKNAPGDLSKLTDFYRDLSGRIDRADETTAHLSVGFGAGWHRTTVGLILEDSERLNFAELRKKYLMAPHRLLSAFPKTRRLVMDSFFSPRVPMGWVELKFG